jgi:hypothetical protein
MSETSKTADEIAKARDAMHDQIKAALRGFTQATGLTVYRTQWLVATALGDRGNVRAVEYYCLQSSAMVN